MSGSHRKQFSRDGFQPLATVNSNEMTNPNDVTIDIPLTKVTSRGQTGARKAGFSPSSANPPDDFPDPMNEKQGRFRRGPGGRRRKIQEQGKENQDGEDGTLTAAGKVYDRIFHFSVLTRYFLYVAPVAMCLAVPIILGATSARSAAIGGVPMRWFFTWVEVVWVSLWVSKLVSQFLPVLFQFLCGVVSSGTRKYALVITALEIPLSLVGWALTSLTTFVPIMTLNPHQRQIHDTSLKPWESIIKDILFAALISTIMYLAEKLLIQLISISYHRKQFDYKIKQSKRNIYLISLLYDASTALFPAYCTEFVEEDYLIHNSLEISGSGDSKKHNRSGSITPARFIQNVGRLGDKVTAAFGNVAHEITGKQVFNPTSAHSVVVEALERKRSSEALARRLWMSFVVEGKDALYPEDIVDVLGPDRNAEAEEAVTCLDVDGNGDISLEEMILRIGEFGRERYSIANSMHDVDQAINVLDNLLCTVVFLAVVLVFVAFLNKSLTTTLATTGTALLSLSFVFATTAQELLGSCIFLFVKHPYDVGDRVDIGDVQLVVERISLLYTSFRRVKDHKKTQVANIVLNTTWVDNISRSNAMREQVMLYINFDTTLEDIELLRKEMKAFVLDKENARDFQSEIDVEVCGVAEMNKLELKVEIRHKSNWANEAVRAARRSKFMCALVLALRKVPIYGPGAGGAPAGDPANPTYSVAITDDQAANNKKEFNDTKDKKRMIPAASQGLLSPTTRKTSGRKSPSVDQSGKGGGPLAAKEAALVENMNPLKAAVHAVDDDEARGAMDLENVDMEHDSDIEEVRGVLRRASTRGRRKAYQQNALAPASSYQSHLPSIVATPPSELPPLLPAQAPRVSYYEDNGYNSMQSTSRGESQVTAQPGKKNAVSGQYFQFPSSYPAQREDEEQGQSSGAPPRRPVPGMPEMKGLLSQNR
jgi:small-conductance mechanosensitive channel